jgi:hypothetical protein
MLALAVSKGNFRSRSYSGGDDVRNRLTRARGWAWKLAIPAAALGVAANLGMTGPASAILTGAGGGHHLAGVIAPARVNLLDCNGWSPKYKSASTAMRMRCTDFHGARYDGRLQRFYDNGHYVGHDEPSVKFISPLAGSGNTMVYALRLPRDPHKAPTARGTVTDYGELSVAPWFGLPMCDPHSYPQNPCTPDSDTNSGALANPNAAGSAFMELQFYPPGFTPFIDNVSCSKSRWCAALTIDSAECTFNFASCNTNCEEPVNFSYLQTNGIPPGSPAPQDPSTKTMLGNAKTLKMNPGDVLSLRITDPAGGFTAAVHDLTTGQTGYIQASAKNGFTDTNMSDCSGNPFTWHAEYSTAKKQNQVPWAALEGGVLMEQEIGHGEACARLISKDGFSASYSNGSSYTDPKVYQTCGGGMEGKGKKGEGPCNVKTGTCHNSKTEGRSGPVPCTSATTSCEFSDGYCLPKGTRPVTISGHPGKEFERVATCDQNQFENGDLDFDGTSYHKDWPNGSGRFPQTFRYLGPFTNGHAYAQIQFETDVAASENLCNLTTGAGCKAPPIGSAGFYPFWSLTNKQTLNGIAGRGTCLWNFGNNIAGVTRHSFGRDAQYGAADTARYGGTLASKVMPNPALAKDCKPVT